MCGTKRTITALMTNKNKPNVNMVIGKATIFNTGLRKVFKKAKTTATRIEVNQLSTVIPSIKFGRIKTNMEMITRRNTIFINLYFGYKNKKKH